MALTLGLDFPERFSAVGSHSAPPRTVRSISFQAGQTMRAAGAPRRRAHRPAQRACAAAAAADPWGFSTPWCPYANAETSAGLWGRPYPEGTGMSVASGEIRRQLQALFRITSPGMEGGASTLCAPAARAHGMGMPGAAGAGGQAFSDPEGPTPCAWPGKVLCRSNGTAENMLHPDRFCPVEPGSCLPNPLQEGGALMGPSSVPGPGLHWYYDLDESAPIMVTGSPTRTPRPGRYHAGLKAGQASPGGVLLAPTLDSLRRGGCDEEADSCRRMDDDFFRLDGTPMGASSYTSQSIREATSKRVGEACPGASTAAPGPAGLPGRAHGHCH